MDQLRSRGVSAAGLTVALTLLLTAIVVSLPASGVAQDGDGDTAPAPAQPAPEAGLPSGATGIAAAHPGDRGIADHAAVLLAESFEDADLDALASRWENVKNPGGDALEFVAGDVPTGGNGTHSLRITATLAEDTGGHLYTRLPRAVDKAFARFYVKFPEGGSYTHHFVHLGGYHPATPWPQGGAGERPDGDKRVTVGIEPHGGNGRQQPPGAWGFYSYWHRMKVCPDGKYWGNVHMPAEPEVIPAGRWQCVEVMLALNTPGTSDGELALWVDGRLVMHIAPGTLVKEWNTGAKVTPGCPGATGADATSYPGLDWRSDADLKVNFFWLLYYVTRNAVERNRVEAPATQSVQFDHIVIATDYIGPITPIDAEADDSGDDDE